VRLGAHWAVAVLDHIASVLGVGAKLLQRREDFYRRDLLDVIRFFLVLVVRAAHLWVSVFRGTVAGACVVAR